MKKGRIIIVNPKKFAWQTRSLKRTKPVNWQVIADFDRTITKCFVDGRRAPTLVGVLREKNYLSSSYARQSQKLFDYYHPIEIDPKIPLGEKKRAMLDWWQQHFTLLIDHGLQKSDIDQAMNEADLHLRPGGREFFERLSQKQVPLIIFSAGGLGEYSISSFLKRRSLFLLNVHIVANSFIWDKTGRLQAVKEPIIHVYNKDETVLPKFPFFSQIKSRRQVILIGDSLGDASMAKGLPHDLVVKIGFLNEDDPNHLAAYRRAFDVVILGDASFYFINQWLRSMVNN